MVPWAYDILKQFVQEVTQNDYDDSPVNVPPSWAALCSAAEALLDNRRTQGSATLDNLISTAYDNMSALPSSLSANWRCLYTDACILKSLADLCELVETNNGGLLASIGRLDHAVVIAGAPGEGRLDFIQFLIKRIQSSLTSKVSHRAPSTLVLSRTSSNSRAPPVLTAITEIPSVKPPSLGSFRSTLFRRPFILKNYISDWPAMNGHPWLSIEYLRSIAGPGRVVPVEVGSDYRSDNWTQRMMPWDDFLACLQSSSAQTDVLYLAQHNLLFQFPALRDDIVIPDYVYTSPPPTQEFPEYKPPTNKDQLVVNVWLGPEGTVSPAHTDPYYNVYAQVCGRKTVWLAPPEMTVHMHPYPHSEPSISHTNNPAANNTNPSMSNTSKIDVFLPQDAVAASQFQFPDFWRKVVPTAMSAVLETGDLLFFPPGWWHGMRSESTSFSVSMWF